MQSECDTGVYDPIPRSHPQVSGYRLIARRGRGGVAEVWEAESPGGHRVALKLVQFSTDLRAGELRALKITRGIRHPGLVIVHGAWQVENLLVISMELADRSLWDRYLEANVQGLRGIPRGELLGYLDPIADAIDYLNGSRHTIDGRQGVGIQHRDLKPQNLLLFGDRAKVGDFGMARVMEGYITGHSGPCTVPYAAPEYFGGRTARQSDQYALAVTYCHLRGGRIPFPGTTAQMAIGHMCNAPDLEGLPEPERPVLARALAKRPEDRWPDCRSFIDALKALGSAGEGSIPDALPRQRRDLSAGRDDAGEPSTPGLDPTDADFIPVDSGELESPYNNVQSPGIVPVFWRGSRVSGLVSRIRARILDRLSRHGHGLRDRLAAGWPIGTDPGRRAAGEAAVRRDRSARLDRIRALATTRLERWRRIGRRAAHRAAVRPEWLRIGSIAALVVSCLVLGNLVWTSAAQHRPAEPSHDLTVAEAGSKHRPDATASDSHETGVTPGPALEPPIVAAGKAPAIPPAPAVPERTPRAPMGPPGPVQVVSADRHVAARPRESTPTTRVVAAKEPGAPAGTHPIEWGLKSALAWLRRSGPIHLASTTASPAPHRPGADKGSIGSARPGSRDRNTGRRPSDRPAAPEVVTPTIALPAEVKMTPGTAAKVHVRVQRRDVARPVQLDLRGLPRGISADGLTIPAGRDSADVVLASSGEPSPGIAEVKVAFTAGSERGEAATRIHVLPPPPAAVAYKRGLAALDAGSLDRAIADFSEAIRLDPDAFEARFYRGISHALAGRSQEALDDYTAAIRRWPDRPEVYRERARAYIGLGAEGLALGDYTEAIRLKPDADAYLARAGLHHEMGSYDEALADCDRALRLRPGDPTAFYLRGLTRYHAGDYAGAVADFTEVLRFDPRDARAYRARGDAHARLGKRAEAEADHEAFERLSRPSGAGGPDRPAVPAGPGGPGAGRGHSP